MEILNLLVNGTVTGLVTGAFIWGAIRIELKYHRRDIDHAHRRIDHIERRAEP